MGLMANFTDLIKNILVPLVANMGLLSILAWMLLIYDRKIFLRSSIDSTRTPVSLGIVFGTVSAIVMFLPIELSPGVITDSRGIPVMFAGIIGGPISAVIAMVISTVVRHLIGGPGWLAGSGLIVAHGVVGLLGRHFFWSSQVIPNLWSIVVITFFATVATLPSILLLPQEFQFGVLTQLMPPLLAVNIVGSFILGTLISRVEKRYLLEQDLVEARMDVEQTNEKLSEHQEHLEMIVDKKTVALQKSQELLLQKEKLAAIGQLSGSVAHDIRNPLGSISNSIYYLSVTHKDSTDKGLKKHLKLMEKEIQRTNDIINDLLDFSRNNIPSMAPGQLNDILSNMLNEISVPKEIIIKTELESNLPQLTFDTSQIRRIAHNLILNAFQAMPKGGTLYISSRKLENFAEIIIKDTGSGISPEDAGTIFEPLFTTKSKGVGLGLAIVKTFIENHNGTITVESDTRKGTTFTVRLPITTPETS